MTATRTTNALLFGIIILALTYGSLTLTKHAKVAHAGERWQAPDIASYLDCHKDQVQVVKLPDGLEKHYCDLNGNLSIGLVIAAAVGVIVTGFCGRRGWWRNRY